MPHTLYIVGTPIGNLEDISARALDVLRAASLIASEDPPRTQRLLARYDLHTPMMHFTDAYDRKKAERLHALLAALERGDVAYVSSAGMPLLADPGYELVQAALERGIDAAPVPSCRFIASSGAGSNTHGHLSNAAGFLNNHSNVSRFWIRNHSRPSSLRVTSRNTVGTGGTVVRGKHDQRVALVAQFFDLLQDLPDVLIDPIDHRGVDLHSADLVFLLHIAKRFPDPVRGG